MTETKRYYWIKLKTDFFNLPEIDYLLSLENGCQYIVLYQMLCVQTANNAGLLATKVGDSIIPFDMDKIVRDSKYFKKDTVMVAMNLFRKLNLLYIEFENCFKISAFEKMVGSETSKASLMREKRLKEKEVKKSNNVTKMLPRNNEQCYEEIDKEIDIDIEVDKEDGMNDILFQEVKKLDFIQENTNKYNEIFRRKNIYLENYKYLPDNMVAQAKLYQWALKRLVDNSQTELVEKVDIEIFQKVFGQVIRKKGIDDLLEYYIKSLTNELVR